MQREVRNSLGREAIVIPFTERAIEFTRSLPRAGDDKPGARWDFVYVASGEPHKNHNRLVKAWMILAKVNIRPSLCITISNEVFPELVAWIQKEIARNDLRIENVAPERAVAVDTLYAQSRALIYPSLLESLGLPLVEARCAGLPILASELDYVRDVIDPEQTFDPESEVSIARAIMRFLSTRENLPEIVSSRIFLERLLAS